jgi:uncharacterized coiled-coil protein SlyX
MTEDRFIDIETKLTAQEDAIESLEAVMNLENGLGSRHNGPSAALRLLAVTRYCLVVAPCI